METITKPKKWGNSVGITIPKKILEEEDISLKDDIIIDIKKKINIKRLKGLFKFKKSAQEIKEAMRAGWE